MIMHGSVNLLGPNFKYVSKLQLKHMKLGRTVLDTYNLCLPLMRPSVQQAISKDKNVMARTRKYYLKNHYLTLRSKIKVQRRSL